MSSKSGAIVEAYFFHDVRLPLSSVGGCYPSKSYEKKPFHTYTNYTWEIERHTIYISSHWNELKSNDNNIEYMTCGALICCDDFWLMSDSFIYLFIFLSLLKR